jgi:vitamin B12 transporter
MKLFFSILFLAAAPVTDYVVVTASSMEETIEQTPASVSIITAEDIERRAARDVSDVLREVPGVIPARTGSPGKATTIFLRGGSSKQTLVLWNGVEMNNPYFSGYDFGQLSTAGVERVEVVRGPFSALYGSEAVSGVVNVLTEPRQQAFRANVEGGDHDLLNAGVSAALTSGRLSAHAALEARSDDGFAPNDDVDLRSVLGGATFTATNAFSIGLLARRAGYDLGIPRTPNAGSTAFVPSPLRRQEGYEWQLAAPIRYERGAKAFELRLSDSRRGEEFSDVAGPFGPEASDTTTALRGARATARFGALTIGGEYEQAAVDHLSNFSRIDDRDRDNRSAFTEYRLSLPSVEIAAGVRYDGFETFGSEVSPRLAAAWRVGRGKLRAAYGEGFRAPAIGELYSPFFGNEELQAERSRTAEIGYDHFAPNTMASVTLFRSDFEELIVFGDDFRFQNIAAADTAGVELAATHARGPWRGSASYTWLDSEDAATGQTLIRRPEHSGSVSFGFDGGAFRTHVVVSYTGERADVTDLLPFGRVTNDAYTVADVVLAYAIRSFEPFLKIENLGDARYEEVFGYPSAPRRAVVGLRYRWGAP